VAAKVMVNLLDRQGLDIQTTEEVEVARETREGLLVMGIIALAGCESSNLYTA
jgi:hypothetical protein